VRRQADRHRQLVRRQPGVHAAHGLVVHVADRIPVVAQHGGYLRPARERPAMAGHQELGLVRADAVEAVGPLPRIAVRRAADRVEVREGLVEVVARQQRRAVRQPDEQRVVGLARRVLEPQADAGDGFLQHRGEGPRRPQDGQRAALAQPQERPHAEVAEGIAAEPVTVHAQRAPVHHRPQLGDERVERRVQRLVGIDDRRLPGLHEAGGAEGVVRVVVRVDDGLQRPAAGDAPKLRVDHPRILHRLHRVHDDEPVVAHQQDRVGDAVAHGHVHAFRDLDDFLAELLAVLGQRGAGCNRRRRRRGFSAAACGQREQ
jgi:hypothetical protein